MLKLSTFKNQYADELRNKAECYNSTSAENLCQSSCNGGIYKNLAEGIGFFQGFLST